MAGAEFALEGRRLSEYLSPEPMLLEPDSVVSEAQEGKGVGHLHDRDS